MGIPFTDSLHQFFERVSLPFNGFLGLQKPAADPQHQLLWDCYQSGQMTEDDLEREAWADPDFAVFIASSQRRHN